MKLKSMKGYVPFARQLVITVALTLFAHTTLAIAFYQNQVFKHGAVMARAMALDENGQPILVEYNADGSEAGEVALGEYADKVDRLHIISAYEYTTQYSRWKEFTDRPNNPLAQDAQLLNVEQYEQATFVTASGEPITKPGLLEHQKSVLVRGRSNRLTTDPSQLILMSFSVDLTQSPPPDDAVSLVMNEHGQIIASSPLNIAPRAGFFGDPNEAQDFYSGYIRKTDDQIFGPVPFIKVYVDEWVYPGGVDVTDSEGKYRLNFRLPPCPGFSFEHTTDVWAELYYTNFSPNGAPVLPYYLRRQDWSFCHGVAMYDMSLGGAMAYTNAVASLATMSVPNYAIDLRVDVMFLTGRILIGNPGGSPGSVVPIPIGDVTEYAVQAPSDTPVAQAFYDFDGDGKPDTAVLGNLVQQPQPDGSTETVFEVDSAGSVQGVYFSSGGTANQPNVIRQADKIKEREGNTFKNNGLLSSISEDDFKNTDILVFRESTGQLVMERRGLRDAEIDGRAQVGLGQNDDNVFYRIMLRGPRDSSLNIGGTNRSGSWDDWASRNKLTTSFQSQESDHLKPGEWIRLVVINRATGYMGTQRIQLSDASQNPGGYLNVPVEDIVLRPPNLKIWAERDYTHDNGLTRQQESRNNIIGAEGAGLVSDDRITIYTEWFDHDGRPLPEGLGVDYGEQYGLTGRLAKIVSPNFVQAVSNSELSNFPIAAGRNMQVLQIRSNLTNPEHYYIHVAGTPKDEPANFDMGGAGTSDAMQYRPRVLTPFLVPLHDEDQDWQTFSAWNQARKAYDAEVIDTEPTKPLPSYGWTYRPEYQFSQFQLEIDSILREYTDESGQAHEQELLTEQLIDGKIPTIRSDDDLVSVFYSLVQQTVPRLTAIEGEQELVMSLGAHELKVTVTDTGEIRFDNLEQLDYLDPTDLLTIRLYLNHDAGNTLWEWAFTRNGLHVYYQVPGNTETRNGVVETDIEILGLLETGEQGTPVNAPATMLEIPSVRTLGGMRLRYRYIPPSLAGTELTRLEWRFGHRGRFCRRYGVTNTTADACALVEANIPYVQEDSQGNLYDGNIYWEPVDANGDTDWSNWAGTQTTDTGIEASLYARYTIPSGVNGLRVPRDYRTNFRVKTRELRPDANNPMEGSDVAMLEAVLWQLGISPQKGSPGQTGARIASNRSGGGAINTETCQGQPADNRSRYYSGWGNGCPSGRVSLEGMVQRFQDRNEITQNGVVDTTTIEKLERDWVSYYSAFVAHNADPVINDQHASFNLWLNNAVDVWHNGIAANNYLQNPTYTQAVHEGVLVSADMAANSRTRGDLLRHWVTHETRFHWGSNNAAQGAPYQATPYRMTEGGADEEGSLSFSQLLYHYRYGSAPCAAHDIEQLNLYNPAQNLLTFTVHTASATGSGTGQRSCQGVFDRAFNVRTLAEPYETNVGAMNHLRDLIGYRHGAGPIVMLGTRTVEDDYEVLAKAIGLYNGASYWFRNDTWPFILKHRTQGLNNGRNDQVGNNCASCEYTIEIRNGRGTHRSFDMTPRSYIWVGARFDFVRDVNGLVLVDANGQPIPHPQAGQPEWCFAYGELEWIDPALNPLSQRPLDWTGYRDAALADVNRRVGCY